MCSPDPLVVRPISTDDLEHAVVAQQGSFTQVPAWGDVKEEWRDEHLGWFAPSNELVGAALVLHRPLPRIRKTFAYVANGPSLPWDEVSADPARWLDPLISHLRSTGAFTVRLGFPGVLRTWSADRAKAAISEGGVLGFRDIEADTTSAEQVRLADWLKANGWEDIGPTNVVPVGQPYYICVLPLAGRTEEDVLAGMNQEWRRNIRKAAKAGVVVERVDPDKAVEAIHSFHDVYLETADRDGFIPRGVSYFRAIEEHFSKADRADVALYEARSPEGELLASAVMVTTAGTCAYLYGGSTTANREYRASNALQWQAIRDALAAGVDEYDFRGFNTTVEGNIPMTGLLRFKLGAGAQIQQLVGEHELVLNKALHKAYELAMRARIELNQRRAGLRRRRSGDAGS